jgi:ferredoxin
MHQTIDFGKHPSIPPFDLKRRHLLGAVGAGIATASLARFLGGRDYDRRLLRPPGSVPEADFVNTCVSCGKCMKVCPTKGLQPCILEAGIEGMWTPRLVPRIGGCERECNMCGQLCPTSAIRKLHLEEKTYAKIGTAVINRSRCIAWAHNRVCLICDEVCPYNAVSALSRTVRGVTLLRPFVEERACMGCGLCESRCPTQGPAAIQVFSDGEERRRAGSYVTDEKKKLRHREESPEDIPSGFILDDN